MTADLLASIPPSIVAILSDPTLPSWERTQRHVLKCRQRTLLEHRRSRGEPVDRHYRKLRKKLLKRCDQQRYWIAVLKENEGTL